MRIEPYDESQREAIVQLSLRAWAPVFAGMEQAMLPAVFRAFYKGDWRGAQRCAVEAACSDESLRLWVALEASALAGFAALRVHAEDSMGEVTMIAVEPGFQRRGIARRLIDHALAEFERAGLAIALIETGGDPGHAPARHTYEATGFTLLPVARYFKAL